MKLFIFEPYGWTYCNGAIGVIAKDFDQFLEDFRKMQKASIFLSKRINVESSVANLISILIKN
jgi:hypothetical protein